MAAKKPRIIVHQGQGSIFFAWGICQFPREQLQLSSRTDAGTVLLPVRGRNTENKQTNKQNPASKPSHCCLGLGEKKALLFLGGTTYAKEGDMESLR